MNLSRRVVFRILIFAAKSHPSPLPRDDARRLRRSGSEPIYLTGRAVCCGMAVQGRLLEAFGCCFGREQEKRRYYENR